MQEPLVPCDDPLSTARRHPEGYAILYIDCDPSQTGDRSRIAWLRDMGGEDIDLSTAPTGECGVTLARSRQPDLIILELGPPWGSGAEVIRLLRESRETYLIPLVALSSTDCEKLPGLSMYCRRPIKAPEFLAMLRILLRRAPDVNPGAYPCRERGRSSPAQASTAGGSSPEPGAASAPSKGRTQSMRRRTMSLSGVGIRCPGAG